MRLHWLPPRFCISIHAPVKGATSGSDEQVHLLLISIHAPVKGATWTLASMTTRRPDFNPRSREGSDHLRLPWVRVAVISIHAPVKGATLKPMIGSFGTDYFNPRSREGSDSHLWRDLESLQVFQSTLP